MDIQELNVRELRDKIISGQITSVDAVRNVFERIDKYDSTIGSYISTFRELALESAGKVDKKISSCNY